MRDVIELAAIRRKVAEKILTDLDLFRKWERFGRPVMVGAFAYDLLLDPDIDMEIYCSDLRIEHGFQVLSECALNQRVTKVRFFNELTGRDKALYWQICYKENNGTEWKIDMWSAPKDYDLPRAEHLIEPIRASLTPETRRIILELKAQRLIDSSLRCPSVDLYRAVLDDDVRTSDDLRTWLASHETGKLSDWRPKRRIHLSAINDADKPRASSTPEPKHYVGGRMEQEKIIEEHYDTVAQEYEDVDQRIDPLLTKLRGVPPGSTILDIGCGTGNLTLRLPEVSSWTRIAGVDLSNGVLAIARERAQEFNFCDIEFHRASALDLPFGQGEFDFVVSNIVFHLVSDRLAYLREVLRVLRSSGRALLQFVGGAPSAPELMKIMQNAWEEELKVDTPVNPLYQILTEDVITPEMMKELLNTLGVHAFEIVWRKNVTRITAQDVRRVLGFIQLVGGFWRYGLPKQAADQIWRRVSEEIEQQAKSSAGFTHTVNYLLVEFIKPE